MFNAYQTSGFVLVRVLIPAWLLHYYMKYHVSVCGPRGWGDLGSASRGLLSRSGREFLHGQIMMGREGMALNYKRGNLGRLSGGNSLPTGQ